MEAIFTFAAHPELPLEKFAQGEVGVLQPTYSRSYLVAAYRNLSGVEFEAGERAGLVALWKERLNYSSPDYDEDTKAWLDARKLVPGVGTAPGISTSRNREKPNEYETYLNCQKDAFENAATTLSVRMKKFGADSGAIKDWVAAQDLVFANCSEGQHIPGPAAADADPLFRADRAYQIAAANFYAGSFDDALSSFEKIKLDPSSPWQKTAAYLSARTLVRKASLGPVEKKSESLAKAEEILKGILGDRGLGAVHPAATRLLSVVSLRLHPEARTRELAQSLMKQRSDDTLKQALWDYTILLDQFIGDDDSDPKKEIPAELLKDDLTDWIVTVQADSESSLDHSVKRWHETGSLPWLVAALTKANSSSTDAPALLSAAAKVNPVSAAFPSAAFHQIRLTMEAGKPDQARTMADEVLTKHKSRLPASSLNLFMSMRMRLAKNLNELLTFAQRKPAGFSWDEDNRELPEDISEDSDFKYLVGQNLFDQDAARVLNERLPLSLLQEAAESKVLSERLQRDVVQAAWLRAVMLDDHLRARQMAPTLRRLMPEIGPFLDDYLSRTQADARKFSGLYAWLKLPGLQPVVSSGVGRRTPVNEQDQYRENWWCAAALASSPPAAEDTESESGKKNTLAVTEKTEVESPAFLTEAQKTAARDEHARLVSFGAAPTYLCHQVIEWAQGHPTDPRVPEALHLAVKTTRYGCTDKQSAKWSKAAFDFLHKRYPQSSWAKQTPYWFKD
jgi:tetratricopeptide (TPR) repeat protein